MSYASSLACMKYMLANIHCQAILFTIFFKQWL